MIKWFHLFCFALVLLRIESKSIKRKLPAYNENKEVESWTGKWFPFPPNTRTTVSPARKDAENDIISSSNSCDDKTLIGRDFNPNDIRHSYNYLCLANRTMFTPSLNRKALLHEEFIPPAYRPAMKCLNETIRYDDKIPTHGAFRLLPPKYGTYQFLPPQRWLRSVAEGAIVMLYHPCAYTKQVELLQKTVSSCMYRHIITPSLLLSPERPMALIAWGKSLQLSVVDENMVVNFIKENAKKGPMSNKDLNETFELYESGLLTEAHLVTDESDNEICGYKEM
ncbi:uncharacterized protein LOC119669381 [Teleopsis dalmanni]|uniref:uncharacterized protein LOC119664924 n=1 Tax=Teleopsis dalmanni TaxID=139649 RepID=UPI0018CD5026|nr:uncharacterized protein LOC119664924 [Teleopsis dalmanni]XP_037933773.1 uncharacterized protein LOC119668366 [Teleopsis dalmanni]XP_037935175.1 uncharacterized protein LOC119669381 [Teleopsis dalmanni]